MKRFYTITDYDSEAFTIATIESGKGLDDRFKKAMEDCLCATVTIKKPFDEEQVIRFGCSEATISVTDDGEEYEVTVAVTQTWLY